MEDLREVFAFSGPCFPAVFEAEVDDAEGAREEADGIVMLCLASLRADDKLPREAADPIVEFERERFKDGTCGVVTECREELLSDFLPSG